MFPLNWDPCSITLALLLRIFILFAWVFLFSKESQGSLLICIVQFSRCCFVFRSLAEHFYYITFRRFCQVLFQVFSKFSLVIFAALLQTSFFIISHSVQFVKCFFQVFFEKLFCCDRQSFQTSFSIISLSSLFVKYFFQVFSKFLSSDSSHAFRATFILYNLSAALSSTFSKKSKISANLTLRSPKTFSIFFCTRPLVRQLYYYITIFLNCQLKVRPRFQHYFV